jgi:hypothetical protein
MSQKKFLLFAFTLIYLLHLGLKFSIFRLDFQLPIWMSSHLADLICMPIFLSFCLFLIQKIIKKPDFSFSWQQIGFQFLYFSIVFEYFLPKIAERYTADIYDVLMYALGSLFFYFFLNKN